MNVEHWEPLAAAALVPYRLGEVHITRAGGASNTNFHIEAGPNVYLLRLHTAGDLDREAIAAELAWREQLCTAVPEAAQRPVPSADGELITVLTLDDGQELLCTLLIWVPGRIPPSSADLTEVQLRAIGTAMARIHGYAREVGIPENFARPAYNGDYFRGRLEALLRAVQPTSFPTDELTALQHGVETLITRVDDRDRGPERFGVIHGDFHSGNYVLDGEQVQIIDFDRCGPGFFLHDLGLALMELEEPQRDFLIQGYQTVAALPPDYAELLNSFICLAFVDTLGFHAASPEELPFILDELPLVTEALTQAL